MSLCLSLLMLFRGTADYCGKIRTIIIFTIIFIIIIIIIVVVVFFKVLYHICTDYLTLGTFY